MDYRRLGKTELEVSVLSYGASPLGSVFRDIDEAEGIRTVHTALDLGMNLIDVSPYYGLTKAETVLGKALRGVDRDRYILTTKVGRYGLDEFDFSAARVTAGGDMLSRRAAPAKLPASTTATNTSISSRRSIDHSSIWNNPFQRMGIHSMRACCHVSGVGGPRPQDCPKARPAHDIPTSVNFRSPKWPVVFPAGAF